MVGFLQVGQANYIDKPTAMEKIPKLQIIVFVGSMQVFFGSCPQREWTHTVFSMNCLTWRLGKRGYVSQSLIKHDQVYTEHPF